LVDQVGHLIEGEGRVGKAGPESECCPSKVEGPAFSGKFFGQFFDRLVNIAVPHPSKTLKSLSLFLGPFLRTRRRET
jgi:hypothetical protein